ncbi:MAG: M20/M25/M40 family metallo-hydrolase [Betaproteobacteria bacterium]
MSQAKPSSAARLAVALVLIALVLIATFAASLGPSVQSVSAPPEVFSAERARVVLQRLAGDGIPHPIGSAQNALVRDRVIAEFRALGYAPAIERNLACAPNGSCGWVENILATLPGRESGSTVILNAHYDSVPAGPGGGDDATGVAAILEVARALRTLPQPRFPVLFLVDDGEEAGLLGAEAFVRRHRPADFASVLVLEARGSSGRTLMFETSQDNRAIVGAYARSVPRPSTSSVYFSIYQRLPNGTNFTTFKNVGMRGMAAAFIGDPAQYHTPLNRVKNIPDQTLQHMGDTGLGVTREIAYNGLGAETGNASYFDVLTLAVVRWPEALNIPVAVVALALLCTLAALQLRAGRFAVREFASSLAFSLVPLVAAGLAGFGVSSLLATRLDQANWPASGSWLVLAAWASGFSAVALSGWLAQGKIRGAAAWTAVWIVMSILGIAAALLLPGASYLLTGPAAVAALLGLGSWIGEKFGKRKRNKIAHSSLAVVIPLVAISVLVFPFALELFEGMGAGTLFGVAILVAIALAPLLPMLVETTWSRRLAAMSLAVAAAAVVAVFITPVYTAWTPRPLALVYQMDRGAATAHWIAEIPGKVVPAELPSVASWRTEPIPSLAIGLGEVPALRTVADAPPVTLAFPEARIVAVEQRGNRSLLRIEMHSPRGARVMRLRFAAQFTPRLVSMGEFMADGKSRTTGVVVMHTVPLEGIVVAVEIDLAAEDSEFVVEDETPGLPTEGTPLVKARGADSVPIHRGDRTLLSTLGRVPKLRY